MLLTRAPLYRRVNPTAPSDLHVLSVPPAFVLSQDQTLKLNDLNAILAYSISDARSDMQADSNRATYISLLLFSFFTFSMNVKLLILRSAMGVNGLSQLFLSQSLRGNVSNKVIVENGVDFCENAEFSTTSIC